MWERKGAIIGGMGATLLIGLPIGGVFVWGMPIAPYMEFPPRTLYVEHAPFSWTALLILGGAVASVCLPFLVRLARAAERGAPAPWRLPFPWWGWLGAGVTFVSWILAWNRFPWFDAFQAYTFFPLWAGYILVVNALTMVRTGRCPMLRDYPLDTGMLSVYIKVIDGENDDQQAHSPRLFHPLSERRCVP